MFLKVQTLLLEKFFYSISCEYVANFYDYAAIIVPWICEFVNFFIAFVLKLYKIIIIFPTETVKDLGFDGPSFAFPDMDGKIF